MMSPDSAPNGWLVLGRWLRYLRESAGMSQKALGRATGYTRATISKAENHGDGSRDLFAGAGDTLGVEDELGRMHDLITDVTGRGVVAVVPGLPRAYIDDLRVQVPHAYVDDLWVQVPLLLATVSATQALLLGQPLADVAHWLKLLAGADAVYVTIGLLTFEFVLEG